MTGRHGRRGGKPSSRADSGRPDDTKKPEVGAGPKKCHGALAPLPNVRRQRRAKRSPLHAGVSCGESAGSWAAAWDRGRRAGEASGSPVPWWVL